MKRLLQGLLVILIVLGITGVVYGYFIKDNETVEINPTIEVVEEDVVEEYSLELYMVGDALLHGAVYTDAKTDTGYDFSFMLENFKPIIAKCDLCYYNQETILGGEELGLSSYPRFNSPQEFGDNMLDLGFNLISTANNHSLDKDEQGIINSLEYWGSKDVVTAGTYLSQNERDAINIYEKNGISYAFLAYTYGTNGLMPPEGKEYLVNVYTDEMLKEDILKVRDLADVVIVSMHWGVEYTNEMNDEQERLATLLSEAGADIVIGAHPHVIQPVKWVNDTIVFYSLGNFISAQDTLNKRIGMIGALTINKVVTNGESVVTINNVRADLFYDYYDASVRNFKLYMFNDLDDTILNDHETVYAEYKKIITKYDDSIKIGLE